MSEADDGAYETKWANWSFAAGSGVFALLVIWGFTFDFNVVRIDDYVAQSLFADAYSEIDPKLDDERSISIKNHVDHQTSVLMIALFEVLAAIFFIVMMEINFLNKPGKLKKTQVRQLYGFCICYLFLVFYALNSWEWMCFYDVNCSELKRELELPLFYGVSFMLIASAPYLGRVLFRGAVSLGNKSRSAP